jgi:hypothetical protein
MNLIKSIENALLNLFLNIKKNKKSKRVKDKRLKFEIII